MPIVPINGMRLMCFLVTAHNSVPVRDSVRNSRNLSMVNTGVSVRRNIMSPDPIRTFTGLNNFLRIMKKSTVTQIPIKPSNKQLRAVFCIAANNPDSYIAKAITVAAKTIRVIRYTFPDRKSSRIIKINGIATQHSIGFQSFVISRNSLS